jgi:tetratricopeptide (TPR) repeat protein
MIKTVYGVVLVLSLAIAAPATAQNIDSLQHVLDTAKDEFKVKTLNELFRAHITADPVKALEYCREALNLATEINDRKGMAASNNNLGVAYRNQGALDQALRYDIAALKIYEELKSKEGIALIKNNISNIYAMKKDYGQAMRYLEESYNILVELGDQKKIIGSMNNLGNLYSDIQLYEQAMKYFQQAHQLSIENKIRFADPLTNMGNIYFKQNNYQRAIESYLAALKMEREDNNRLSILSIVTNLGIAYTKAKQPKLAIEYLEEALALNKELQAYSASPSIYKSFAENYYIQGKMKEAYETLVKYDEAREKIYGEESSRNIAQMEMVLRFQEKERQYDVLKKEAEINNLELRNSRLFIVMIIMIIFVVLGGLNIFYINSKKTHKKKQQQA